MFTGIIEEIGEIENIQRGSQSAVLHICCHHVLQDAKVGDSIAVNGVCLTVTTRGEKSYTADVMTETLNRSSLGDLKRGSRVNLERAMPADGRFGGHIVAGHIDGTGTIQSISKDEMAVWYKIQASPEILRYVVEKGSIAIDGISLTVAKVSEQDFSVSVIPHTRANTVLVDRGVGDRVNLETDIIGKYVEKLCRPGEGSNPTQNRVSMELLRENGFV